MLSNSSKYRPNASLVVILTFGVSLLANAVPPRPDLIEGRDPQVAAQQSGWMARAAETGFERGKNLLAPNAGLRRDDPAEVTLRVPVILIDFADNGADQQAHDAAYYNTLLFSQGEMQIGSVQEFYLENSLGNVTITGEVVGWYRAPQNYSYYTNRQNGLGMYPRNAQRLAEDAIRLADNNIDYRRFDANDDGVVDAVMVIHSGGGAEEDPNNVNKIWSHSWQVDNAGIRDGKHFSQYVVLPEDAKIGVCSHELGHALFDLPDLYDGSNDSYGLGLWSLMAYGSWGDRGRRPTHIDAWCKSKLGWIQVTTPAQDIHYTLPAMLDSAQAIKLWTPAEVDSEYFLAEYRPARGFDQSLPGGGLIVYHVDERMPNNDHPWWPGHQGDRHDLIAIEQADGSWDLERRTNAADAGDPFPGSDSTLSFNKRTVPGALSYAGDTVGVAIENIQIVDSGVEADWLVGVPQQRPYLQRLTLRRGWNLVSLKVVPTDLDVRTITAPLREGDILRFVKDGSGHFYVPDLGFNNIPAWNTHQGYLVYVSRDSSLAVEGAEIAFDEPIPLHDNWNIAAYYPDYILTPQRGFAGLGGGLLMAKDGSGHFYLPSLNFNNMANLRTGQGYYVRVTGNPDLVYPTER